MGKVLVRIALRTCLSDRRIGGSGRALSRRGGGTTGLPAFLRRRPPGVAWAGRRPESACGAACNCAEWLRTREPGCKALRHTNRISQRRSLRSSWATCCVQSCRSYLARGFLNSPHGLGSAGGVAIGADTTISFAFPLAPTAPSGGALRVKRRRPGHGVSTTQNKPQSRRMGKGCTLPLAPY